MGRLALPLKPKAGLNGPPCFPTQAKTGLAWATLFLPLKPKAGLNGPPVASLDSVGQFNGRTEFSRGSVALACGPLGLNLNRSIAAGCVMEKAAAWPIFGALAQSMLHRVPMNVVKLLYKLRMIANVEVVIAPLPEMVGVSDQTPRYSLLQRLEDIR